MSPTAYDPHATFLSQQLLIHIMSNRRVAGMRDEKQVAFKWKTSFDRLASRWADFVDCPKRLKQLGPFIMKQLSPFDSPRVLDACMGIGCETISLTSKGVDVVGNEISPQFRRIAAAEADRQDVDIRISSVDWRELVAEFGPEAFDAVLVLGNSLCLLRKRRDRLRAIENFGNICRPGGIVLVDERNFRYILRNRRQIVLGKFRYSGRVMYCGTKVRGRPIHIGDDRVTFVYENCASGGPIGKLDMYPFRKGEIMELFRPAGFPRVDVYSDLERGYRDDADFFTYVLRKSG